MYMYVSWRVSLDTSFSIPSLHVHVVGGCLGRLVWFVVDEYYCSETTTVQACLGYVSLGHCRAARHTRH